MFRPSQACMLTPRSDQALVSAPCARAAVHCRGVVMHEGGVDAYQNSRSQCPSCRFCASREEAAARCQRVARPTCSRRGQNGVTSKERRLRAPFVSSAARRLERVWTLGSGQVQKQLSEPTLPLSTRISAAAALLAYRHFKQPQPRATALRSTATSQGYERRRRCSRPYKLRPWQHFRCDPPACPAPPLPSCPCSPIVQRQTVNLPHRLLPVENVPRVRGRGPCLVSDPWCCF